MPTPNAKSDMCILVILKVHMVLGKGNVLLNSPLARFWLSMKTGLIFMTLFRKGGVKVFKMLTQYHNKFVPSYS